MGGQSPHVCLGNKNSGCRVKSHIYLGIQWRRKAEATLWHRNIFKAKFVARFSNCGTSPVNALAGLGKIKVALHDLQLYLYSPQVIFTCHMGKLQTSFISSAITRTCMQLMSDDHKVLGFVLGKPCAAHC